MWKPSKKTLFIITVVLLTITGILYQQVDWVTVSKGNKIIRELHLPTLFLFLGIYYLWMYILKVKAQK